MADVILYGAESSVLNQGALPAGWEAIRLEYEDGATDPISWMGAARDLWTGAGYAFDVDVLRAVVVRYEGRPTGAAFTIRDTMASRLRVSSARLVLAVPQAEEAWTQGQADASPHAVRTYVTTPAGLQAWIAAHTWPAPCNPALGGAGRRVGGGIHVPWELCVTDPAPSQVAP